DPLLDSQIAAAERLRRGDRWGFTRRGDGNTAAVYSAAGAAYLAQTLPEATSEIKVYVARCVNDPVRTVIPRPGAHRVYSYFHPGTPHCDGHFHNAANIGYYTGVGFWRT